MATSSKTRTPASTLNLEKEKANKMFIQPPKSSIKPQRRNPITQEDVEDPVFSRKKKPEMLYADPKYEGIKMGEYAAKSKQSDIFGAPESDFKASRKYISQSNSACSIPSASLKKSEYQPPLRNPITQDSLECNQPRVRTKISESTAFEHLHDQRGVECKTRDNI